MANDAKELKATGVSIREELRAEARTPPPHLHYEQLEAYVDSTVDDLDREIVESHLELCAGCAADAQDLRAFKAQLGAYPDPVAQTDRTSRSPGAFWKRSFYGVSLQFAAAAALILLLVWVATLPLKKRIANLQATLDDTQKRNEELENQAADIAALQAKVNELEADAQNPSRKITHELYDGGRLVTVDNQGNLIGMESIPQEIQQTVKGALTAQRAELPADVRGLTGRTGTLLGGSGEGVSIALIGPVGTVVKAADRPTFRWRALSGASSYTIDVFDSSLKRVSTSGALSGTEWMPSQRLERGKIYSWQVSAIKDGKEITSPIPPAPEARFKVLDRAKSDELSRAKKSYPNSHLILGALYEKAGLLDDAEREFKLLLSGNPNSPVVQKLLQSVKSLR